MKLIDIQMSIKDIFSQLHSRKHMKVFTACDATMEDLWQMVQQQRIQITQPDAELRTDRKLEAADKSMRISNDQNHGIFDFSEKDLGFRGRREACYEQAPEDALEQVLEVSGSSIEEVFSKNRGSRRNPVRTVAAWWMVVSTGLPNREVAKRLEISNASVGRAIRRIRSDHIRQPDSVALKWASLLEKGIK